MEVNGESKEIDPGRGTVPVILEGRTILPIRAIIEAIGGTINWDEKERKVTIQVKDTVIALWIDKNTTRVNGTDKTTDVAPQIINARTMLPLRFVAENLGCEVNWEETTKKIIITVKGAIVEPEGSQQSKKIAAIITPVYMYYLERYFSDIDDKTQTDLQIKSILDNSPEGRALLLHALKNYREIPEETKYQIFDEKTVQLTAAITEPFNFESIRERIGQVGEPILIQQTKEPPAAPSALVAKNVSKFADPDTPGSEKYQIELKWQDNSNDEDGFRIYRIFKEAETEVPGGRLDLIASVGPNVTTFVDSLTKPANKDDQYCYQVVAFKSAAFALVGQPPEKIESIPSNQACSYYDPLHALPPPLPDFDKDGTPDKDDECPGVPGDWPHGCPDKDGDGVHDFKDKCPNEYYPSEDGCPIKYNLRWMGMQVLNNSAAYAYGKSAKGLYENENGEDAWKPDGEEPYLVFNWTNGMLKLEGQGGMMIHGGARWCCGERVDIEQGKNYEPDEDGSGEEYPLNLNDLRDHGLQVFPAAPGKFSPIDGDLGLVLGVTLMERDWTATITPGKKASELEAAFKVGGAVVGAVSTCVGSGGLGCLASIGGAIKTVMETILGLSSEPPPVEVDDPDDFQGTEVWAITRSEADYKTSGNGAYAFWIELPMTYTKYVDFWWPYGPGSGGKLTTAIAPMRTRLYFCLYREGTPESEIKKTCSSYEQVLPWPMVP
ncbi:MAG: copper amine oxidase N-terminal domain-containing protein [Peptococcaceae bacterium]|nr:MAG: copper amine oxidase N-terminal domain-containing protein [Peptococcaceae bacterium]